MARKRTKKSYDNGGDAFHSGTLVSISNFSTSETIATEDIPADAQQCVLLSSSTNGYFYGTAPLVSESDETQGKHQWSTADAVFPVTIPCAGGTKLVVGSATGTVNFTAIFLRE